MLRIQSAVEKHDRAIDKHDRAILRIDATIQKLAESQQRTDDVLNALIKLVDRTIRRNGKSRVH
jgi:hypothetical protein